MKIQPYAKALNERLRSSSLENFQVERAKRLGIQVGCYDFFSGHTIKEDYAYHHGGNAELQFNVGFEGKRGIFRYGVAFSIQRSHSVQDPVGIMSPKLLAFNQYFRENQEDFKKYILWRIRGHELTYHGKPITIQATWNQEKTFIFLGKELPISHAKLSDQLLNDIVSTFEELYPLYVRVESPKYRHKDKLSKICWNENAWQKPSGLAGKSKDKNAHERLYGFGHEEWLFDLDKLIDGYHYSFLQSIGKYRNKYTGSNFTISLYSTNSSEGNRNYWIAKINDVEVITKSQEAHIISYYKRMNWLDEMENQLNECGVNASKFNSEIATNNLFNIRFKPQDIEWFDEEITPFKPGEKVNHTRYTLLDFPTNISPSTKSHDLIFSGKSEESINSENTNRTVGGQRTIECSNLHALIQKGLLNYLKNQHPGKVVEPEVSVAQGAADLAVRLSKNSSLIYEIKTYPSAKKCIREAFGQLMEYGCYPDQHRAKELIIVSHAALTTDDREYISHIKKRFNIPLSYIQFDHENSVILDQC